MNSALRSCTVACFLLVGGFLLASGYTEFVSAGAGVVPQPLPRGSTVPDAVVYSEDGSAAPFSTFAHRELPTSLIIFNAVCSSCSAEALVWDSVATSLANRMTVLAIACTPDRSFGHDLRRSVGIDLGILRCDDSFPRTVGATGLPTVYVVSPAREVLFSDAGPGATANLVTFLQDK